MWGANGCEEGGRQRSRRLPPASPARCPGALPCSSRRNARGRSMTGGVMVDGDRGCGGGMWPAGDPNVCGRALWAPRRRDRRGRTEFRGEGRAAFELGGDPNGLRLPQVAGDAAVETSAVEPPVERVPRFAVDDRGYVFRRADRAVVVQRPGLAIGRLGSAAGPHPTKPVSRLDQVLEIPDRDGGFEAAVPPLAAGVARCGIAGEPHPGGHAFADVGIGESR